MSTTVSMTSANSILANIPAFNPSMTNFADKKSYEKLITAVMGSLRFNLNKLVHRAGTLNIGGNMPFVTAVEGMLEYYVGRDNRGILRGGNTPWAYLQDSLPTGMSYYEKRKAYCRMLAQLPGNVAFSFAVSPTMKDIHIVHDAFIKAGFSPWARKTLTYTGSKTDGDPISKIKSDSRTKVNSARRDLEIVSMGIREFFDYYGANLKTVDKDSYFHLNIDCELMEKAELEKPQVEIMGARRKGLDANGNPYPIDAAVACSLGADGFYKLMRISYRHFDENQPELAPHKHALKMLVVEAMKRSAELGLVLDVDGATQGGETLYTRFGVFEHVPRYEYQRRTANTLLKKYA